MASTFRAFRPRFPTMYPLLIIIAQLLYILRAFRDQPAKNRLLHDLVAINLLKGNALFTNTQRGICLHTIWQRIPYLPLTLPEVHYQQGICLGHSFKK